MLHAMRSNVAWLFWLVMFLLAGGTWIYSHYRYCELDRDSAWASGGVSITTGQLGAWMEKHSASSGARAKWDWRHSATPIDFSTSTFNGMGVDRAWVGFRFARQANPTGDYFYVAIPLWFLTVLLAAMASLSIRRRLRLRQRMGGNLCDICGYDLRATPQRCPECGATPKKSFEPLTSGAQPTP